MITEKDFVIDQVKWHTQTKRNYEFDISIIYLYFSSVINYLQNNNLTTRTILKENQDINENTCIMFSDLTEDGFKLIKKTYDKWVDKVVDKKISHTDYKIFDKELKNIRT